MTTENPYIFLKNNLFLQFLIADRYRIYRHIAGCSSLLLFFTLSRKWGWLRRNNRSLGLDREMVGNYRYFLPKYVCAYSAFFLQREARYLYHPPYAMGIFYAGLFLLSQFCTMERLYDWGKNQNGIKNSYFCNTSFYFGICSTPYNDFYAYQNLSSMGKR